MNDPNPTAQLAGNPGVVSSELLADALRGLIKLLDDRDLVRNIEHDSDMMAFTRQAIRLANALNKAYKALNDEASANDQAERQPPNNS
jgi:hypothetical protein